MSEIGYYGNLTTEQEAALAELRKEAAPQIAALEVKWQTLWNVSLSDLSNSEPLTKKQAVVLLKFLRAREFQAAEATTMLINTLKWRQEFDTEKLQDEKFSSVFNDLGLIYGADKKGKPVTYNFYGSIGQEEIYSKPELFLRWRIQIMEKAISLLDFENGIETVTQVHDYEGASLFLDKRIKVVTKQIIQLFQDHYPELLERKFFLGVPTVMEYLFSLFSAFVSKRTKDKFIVASKGRSRTTLLEFIAPDQLPQRYGGFQASASSDDEIQEITIAARKNHVVTIPAIKKGDELIWEFTTTSLDIGVTAAFEKAASGEEAKIEKGELPTGKVEGGTGSLTAGEDGVLRLTFDNSYSMLTEKTILYRIKVKSA